MTYEYLIIRLIIAALAIVVMAVFTALASLLGRLWKNKSGSPRTAECADCDRAA